MTNYSPVNDCCLSLILLVATELHCTDDARQEIHDIYDKYQVVCVKYGHNDLTWHTLPHLPSF